MPAIDAGTIRMLGLDDHPLMHKDIKGMTQDDTDEYFRLLSERNRAAREARAAAKAAGLKATMSPSNNYGGFKLTDPATNAVVAGAKYDLSAAEVIAWVKRATEGRS